ncbi:MAG: hypothetical protein WCM76_14555 [Bacteroidota bacterium]|jgi:hypothetical protein
MKENEVIKDIKKQKMVLYAEKEDGTYGSVESGSYLIENLLDDFWYKKRHLEQTLRQKLMKGEISPIHYFMVLEDLTPSELASRAGLGTGKVKKHLQMKHFENIKVSELKRYASVFNIPVANLFQVVISSQDSNIKYHFYNEDENSKEQFTTQQHPTDNPYIIITKASEL